MNLSELNLPSWLPSAIRQLMETAEVIFGEGTGDQKKAWVTAAAVSLVEKVDIKWLPDAIEDTLLEGIVSLAIEILWALYFSNDAVLAAMEEEPIGVLPVSRNKLAQLAANRRLLRRGIAELG